MTSSTRLMRFLLLAFAGLFAVITHPAAAQEDPAGGYIREQQREDCERQGGRYSYPRCYLPPAGGGADQDGRPYGRLHHKSVGSCS